MRRRSHKKINMKKLHCKNCGGVTHLSDKVDGYLELTPIQMSPWRCEHCGAVYEFVVEGDPTSGYKLANNPNLEIEKQKLMDVEKVTKLKETKTRAEIRQLTRKKGKSKHTRKQKSKR